MRKQFFLLLEIFIGVLLFGLLLFMGIDKIKTQIGMNPTYTVKFKDVDGLNVGSPVRLMGKQIGNITKLELVESEIYVTYRITERNADIPKDSIASIQFTGLAGSKSLEIMPIKKSSLDACRLANPDPKLCSFLSEEKGRLSGNKIVYSQEPVRISSILQVQTTIFENVLEFCRGVYTFLSKNNIDSTKKNLKMTSEYMKESNQSLDETLKNIKKSGTSISKNTKEIKQFLDEQNKNIDSAYKSFDTLAKDRKLKENMDNFQTSVEKLSSSINTDKTSKKVSELTNNLNTVNSKVKNFNQKISKVKNREIDYISDVNNSIQRTTDNLQGFINYSKDKLKTDKTNSNN